MRTKERAQARALRAEGRSVKEIAKIMAISVGSISPWVRGVPLTVDQRRALASRSAVASLEGQAKGWAACADARARRWAKFTEQADQEWPILSQNPKFMFGLALYVGEGTKCCPNAVGLVNTDVRVLRSTLDFYRLVGVEMDQIRARLMLHDINHEPEAKAYWCRELGLTLRQFTQTHRKAPSSSRGKRGNKHPQGMLALRVNSTELRQKLGRWMDLALESPPVGCEMAGQFKA